MTVIKIIIHTTHRIFVVQFNPAEKLIKKEA